MTQREAILNDLDRIAAKKQAIFAELNRVFNTKENSASLGAKCRHIGLSEPIDLPKCFDFEIEERRSGMRMFNFETIMPVTRDELASIASIYDMKVVRTYVGELKYSIPYRGNEKDIDDFMNYREGWWENHSKDRLEFYIMAHNDAFGRLDMNSETPVLLFYRERTGNRTDDFFFLVSSWGRMKYDRFHLAKSILNGSLGATLKVLLTLAIFITLSIKVSCAWLIALIIYLIMMVASFPVEIDRNVLSDSSLSDKDNVFYLPRRRMWMWHLFPLRIWTIKLKNRKDCNE